MALEHDDLALMSARFGVARFGATRFGFIPCPEDVTGSGSWPGEYIWREEHEPETEWTLVSEDCVCRNLCTLALGTITPDDTPTVDVLLTVTSALTGVIGEVTGVTHINWGDGGHDEEVLALLENGTLEFEHTYNDTGSYTITLTVTDERGCVATQTLAVTVAAAMVASFTWTKAGEDTTVYFTDTSTGSPDTWDWDFGDTNTSADQNPNNAYTLPVDPDEEDTFTVTLTASNDDGSDGATASVTINYNDAASGSGS